MSRFLCSAIATLCLVGFASAQIQIEIQPGKIAANFIAGKFKKIDGDKIVIAGKDDKDTEYPLAKEIKVMNGREEVKEGIKSEMLKEGTMILLTTNADKQVTTIQLKGGAVIRPIEKPKEDK